MRRTCEKPREGAPRRTIRVTVRAGAEHTPEEAPLESAHRGSGDARRGSRHVDGGLSRVRRACVCWEKPLGRSRRGRARGGVARTAAGPPTAHHKQHSGPTPFASTHGRQLSFKEVLSFELRFPPNEIPRANSLHFRTPGVRLWEKWRFFLHSASRRQTAARCACAHSPRVMTHRDPKITENIYERRPPSAMEAVSRGRRDTVRIPRRFARAVFFYPPASCRVHQSPVTSPHPRRARRRARGKAVRRARSLGLRPTIPLVVDGAGVLLLLRARLVRSISSSCSIFRSSSDPDRLFTLRRSQDISRDSRSFSRLISRRARLAAAAAFAAAADTSPARAASFSFSIVSSSPSLLPRTSPSLPPRPRARAPPPGLSSSSVRRGRTLRRRRRRR